LLLFRYSPAVSFAWSAKFSAFRLLVAAVSLFYQMFLRQMFAFQDKVLRFLLLFQMFLLRILCLFKMGAAVSFASSKVSALSANSLAVSLAEPNNFLKNEIVPWFFFI
jgi:hypothetical protein